MKLANKNLITATNARLLKNTFAEHDKNPQFAHNNTANDVSFKGYDFTRTKDKLLHRITYTNMGEVSAKINKVLGDNFFSDAISKAGLQVVDDKLILQNQGFLKDLARTLKYPFVSMPRDIINALARGAKKIPFLSATADRVLAIPLLSRRAQALDVEKNLEIVTEIMDNFADGRILGKTAGAVTSFDSEKCLEKFKSGATSRLISSAKHYSSRDERTLNRMVTSTVSALYGAADFHNISMLQKDDKNEAKKAGKGRFKQEMYRMCFNAGTTFLTMGALDKYIKHSMPLSVMAIGISAVLAEVVSRLISKTPLKRLSPEEAEKIARKSHPELAEALKNSDNKPNGTSDAKNVNFKQRLEDINRIFIQFQSHDGRFPAMKCLDNDMVAESHSKKKKKISPKQILLASMGVAGAVYIISSVLKGKYRYRKNLKALFDANKDAVLEHIQNPDIPLSDGLATEFKNLAKGYKDASEHYSTYKIPGKIFSALKKLEVFTTKKVDIELEALKQKVETLKQTSEGSKIGDILDKYLAEIEANMTPENLKGNRHYLSGTEVRTLPNAVCKGFAKLFTTVYKVLAFPVSFVDGIIDKTIYKQSNEAAEIIRSRRVQESFTGETEKLYSLLKKANVYKPKGIKAFLARLGLYKVDSQKAYANASKEIVDNVRNFAQGPDTGDLANNSRTLVTGISTYFFVNDYTNKVLIESAGKDTQKAKEERNQRLAHKASNFVFNGTLMNLFNSVFVKPLNRSLIGATLVAAATETTNEFLVRKSICQPVRPMGSKQEIIDFEQEQMSKKGILGAWSRFYRKVTGKKSLTQKTGVGDKKVG